jgi:hypothetical protein
MGYSPHLYHYINIKLTGSRQFTLISLTHFPGEVIRQLMSSRPAPGFRGRAFLSIIQAGGKFAARLYYG